MINDEYNVDKEVTALFNNAKDKIRVVENDSVRQKKQIVMELAKNLEGRIATNTICIEIKHQLRGAGVSDRHIEECLEEKYKQAHRVKNALKRNKSKSQSIQQIENLDALPRLNLEDDLMEKDEEGENEINKRHQENIIECSNGQILILNDNERDQDTNFDLCKIQLANANAKVPIKEIFSEELTSLSPDRGDGKEEFRLSVPSDGTCGFTSCPQCIKKNVQNRQLELINLELAEVIREFDQFQTADKSSKSSHDNNEVSKDHVTTEEDIAEFEDYKTYREVSEYLKPFFKLGNSAEVPFGIKIDFANRKLISLHLGKIRTISGT